jgi:hypothetical protein
MVTTAVSSARVAVVDCGVVGRSAVYSRYKCLLTYSVALVRKRTIPTEQDESKSPCSV